MLHRNRGSTKAVWHAGRNCRLCCVSGFSGLTICHRGLLHHGWRADAKSLIRKGLRFMTKPRMSRAEALFDLHDRVAIVTGGAGLLGYHHGAILAAAGARVVLLDLPGANPELRANQ